MKNPIADPAACWAFLRIAMRARDYVRENEKVRDGIVAVKEGRMAQEEMDELNKAMGIARAALTKAVRADGIFLP